MVTQSPIVKASRWLAKKAEASPSEVLELKSAYLAAREKVTNMSMCKADLHLLARTKEILDRHHGVVS